MSMLSLMNFYLNNWNFALVYKAFLAYELTELNMRAIQNLFGSVKSQAKPTEFIKNLCDFSGVFC